MDFASNQQPQIQEMLAAIGIADIEELFQDIPRDLRFPKPSYDDGISEYEGMQLMESIAAKNTFPSYENYLGAGAYEHHVPAIVGAICSKSEFLTSYTPYQPEISQGMLQIIFEFQSAICALTGLDCANASLYDGASACAEAMLMALRCNPGRNKILVAHSLHPSYRAVVNQYVNQDTFQIQTIPLCSDGSLDISHLKTLVDSETAAILVQYPTFFGTVDDVAMSAEIANQAGALTVVCANPLVYGLYQSADEIGADIAVGDCQPFGISLQFGGPYAGYISCKEKYLRQLPGRIVGETVDSTGKPGFVLTLQAREQHIRREKATSNICTNQALSSLASLVSLLWYGKKGVSQLALTNYQRASYLQNMLKSIPGITLIGSSPVFNEFAVKFSCPLEKVFNAFRKEKIEPGLDLGRFYPEYKNHLLIAVTETKNQDQLDRYVEIAKKILLK